MVAPALELLPPAMVAYVVTNAGGVTPPGQVGRLVEELYGVAAGDEW